MLLVIDNFDSFTFNLVQYCGELGADVVVRRNDVSISDFISLQPEAVLISPGPCTPSEAGSSVEAIQYFAGRIPVLGVCLGHQSLAQAFGGRVVKAQELRHGKVSMVQHGGDDALFQSVPTPFQATRYHSLVVDRESLPDTFAVTAWTDDAIMAIRHLETGAVGVQFHPESILTVHGRQILGNFLGTFMHVGQLGAYSA